jgi:hypothetical protein
MYEHGHICEKPNGRPLRHQDQKFNTKLLQEGKEWRLKQELE